MEMQKVKLGDVCCYCNEKVKASDVEEDAFLCFD